MISGIRSLWIVTGSRLYDQMAGLELSCFITWIGRFDDVAMVASVVFIFYALKSIYVEESAPDVFLLQLLT